VPELDLQPITYEEACTFIEEHHRHHLSPVGWKFGIGVSRPIGLGTLRKQLREVWSKDTSFCPSEWSTANPALGQCTVTALIVQEIMGGELMRCEIDGGGHYFNHVDGHTIDLTASQFQRRIKRDNAEIGEREYLLGNKDVLGRYLCLKDRLTLRKVCGVITVGRPVSRVLDKDWTLEVTRCCTDGTKNAASMLYGAAWRATKALGYKRLITYTLISETGTSLRAAGWKKLYETSGGSWNCKSRPRVDKAPTCQKSLWEAVS